MDNLQDVDAGVTAAAISVTVSRPLSLLEKSSSATRGTHVPHSLHRIRHPLWTTMGKAFAPGPHRPARRLRGQLSGRLRGQLRARVLATTIARITSSTAPQTPA
ncbi:hypothetical protein GCM10010232_25340 [Streptomyces amakusaensis]